MTAKASHSLRRPSTVLRGAILGALATAVLLASLLALSGAAQAGTAAPAATTPASALPQTTSTPASALPTATATTPATTPTVTVGTPATAGTPAATAATPTATTPTTPATGSTTIVVAHKAKSQATHLSTLAIVLAILGALLLLGCLVWALGRWLALEPRWAVSLMHSLREASYRGSATWAEFSDWARLGR